LSGRTLYCGFNLLPQDFQVFILLIFNAFICFVSAGAFLASVAGISAIMGFGTTLSYARRKDPEFFSKGVAPAEALAESGALLATRALAWGTVYAVGGCSILFYGLWKLSGCKDVSFHKVLCFV